MPIDPITAETTRVADHREPVFAHPDQADAAGRKLVELEGRTGKRPNFLIVLFDEVGWGDLGC
jgi:hypothetical protein